MTGAGISDEDEDEDELGDEMEGASDDEKDLMMDVSNLYVLLKNKFRRKMQTKKLKLAAETTFEGNTIY